MITGRHLKFPGLRTQIGLHDLTLKEYWMVPKPPSRGASPPLANICQEKSTLWEAFGILAFPSVAYPQSILSNNWGRLVGSRTTPKIEI